MKVFMSQMKFFCKQLILLVVVPVLLLLAQPSYGQEGGRMLLSMEMSADRRSAEVFVPSGYTKVILMRFDPRSGWRNAVTRNVSTDKIVFALPRTPKTTQWRAMGIFPAKLPQRKFPESFYKGKRAFGNSIATQKSGPRSAAPDGLMLGNASVQTGTGVESVNSQPVEADIWKVDGTKIYFFNQLRGLQVIDVANPRAPLLLASLRLPAMGEDLYLLPGTGDVRELILITQATNADYTAKTLIRVVRFADQKLEIVHEMEVSGYTSDSRMMGDRLILATTEWVANHDNQVWQGYRSRCQLSQWKIRSGEAPIAGEKFELSGSQPIIAAGSDWLAASVTPDGKWSESEVSVFSFGQNGLVRMQGMPIRPAGGIRDKFKMQWKNHVLTTISERRDQDTSWRPVTILENFRVWSPDVIAPTVITESPISSLELAAGESLYATRFAGEKAYIVTFLQTDPLWVVDLRDENQPVVAGHIEVPGWSTYLETIGDLLFSVGWESNTVAASLFDVADPAEPKLLRRINLGTEGSYSEAAWNEKALKLLPNAGLAMIPLSYYDSATNQQKSQVQLLDVDLTKRDLVSRGVIDHQFDARRSEALGDSVISISQRSFIAADISNRDKPEILSELKLAWPVDEILEAGSYLIHIEKGNFWSAEHPTARVTLANHTEEILAEVDLGEGRVNRAELRDGKLYILRDSGGFNSWYYRPIFPGFHSSARKIQLDVFDASALPRVSHLGSHEVEIGGQYQVSRSGLLWPQPNRPTVLLEQQFFYYRPYFPIVIDMPLMINGGMVGIASANGINASVKPWSPARELSQVLAFDVSDPAAITAAAPVPIGTSETILNGVASAADGLIVVGASDNGAYWFRGNTAMKENIQSMHVIQVASSGLPVVRPAIDLPSDLVAVTELDQAGFLAWTRTSRWSGASESQITVSASDGFDAYEITSQTFKALGQISAWGRNFVASQGSEVKQFSLDQNGKFNAGNSVTFPYHVSHLRVERNVLVAATWNSVSVVTLGETTPTTWNFQAWGLNAEMIRVAQDGDLLVPFGRYGAERIDR